MRKKTRPRTRQIIKERLAIGQSYKESIKGTGIASQSTAGVIAKQDKEEIVLMRKAYIAMIEQNGAGDSERAEQWGKMTKAKKLHGKSGKKEADWSAREKALKYVDKLKGLSSDSGNKTQVNFFNQSKTGESDFVN